MDDESDDDIYESLLRATETSECDPFTELEAFLKKIHGEENEIVNQSLVEDENEEKPEEIKSDDNLVIIPEEKGNENDGIGEVQEEGIKSTVTTRVLRPRPKVYWNESFLVFLKAQENMYSYCSKLRKKR